MAHIDLQGNMIEESAPFQATEQPGYTQEPIIDLIYLGGHRLASITQAGDACFIGSVFFLYMSSHDKNWIYQPDPLTR